MSEVIGTLAEEPCDASVVLVVSDSLCRGCDWFEGPSPLVLHDTTLGCIVMEASDVTACCPDSVVEEVWTGKCVKWTGHSLHEASTTVSSA